MKWLILALGIASNASASVLVKIAMTPPRRFPSFDDPWSAAANWPFWLGLVLYGTAFLLYAAALTRLPLNVAHPVLTSGSIAVVAVLSLLVFQERFYLSTVLGIAFIVLGVLFVTAGVR